jgi:Rieske Fe-S protein
MHDRKISRRTFLRTAGKDALTVALAAPFIGSSLMASSKSVPVPMEPIILDVTKPEYEMLGKAGGALKIPNPHDKKKPIIINRTSDTTVAAFSSKCNHWGCEVPIPIDNVIKCECHGSVFDGSGKVIKGPAHKNLPQFTATLEGSIITIKDPD